MLELNIIININIMMILLSAIMLLTMFSVKILLNKEFKKWKKMEEESLGLERDSFILFNNNRCLPKK